MTSFLNYMLDWEYDPPTIDTIYDFCIYTDKNTPTFTFSGKIGYYHTTIVKPEKCMDFLWCDFKNLPDLLHKAEIEIYDENTLELIYVVDLYITLDRHNIYFIVFQNRTTNIPHTHICGSDRFVCLDMTLEPNTDHILCAMKNGASDTTAEDEL